MKFLGARTLPGVPLNGGTLLYVTTRTMANLGRLYLNNGTWDGLRTLPIIAVTAVVLYGRRLMLD